MKALCLCSLQSHCNGRLPKCIAYIFCLISFATLASGQTLSANSGINPLDTHVVFDLVESSAGTVTLPNAVFNPSTQTTTNVLNVSPLPRSSHVEAGYDTSGSLVMNIYFASTTSDPSKVSVSPVSVIRYAKGTITLFDRNNAPIPLVLPSANMNALGPLSMLGSSPGASLVGKLAVSNLQGAASSQGAALSVQGNTALMSLQGSAGTQVVWSYAQSGSAWVAQQVQVSHSLSNGSSTRTLQFANLAVFDNATADATRASQSTTLQAPPLSNSNVYSLTASSSGCNPNISQINQLGGAQNIAFEHGFLSGPCTWTRMYPWMNKDFLLGTELIAKTSGTDGLAVQGADLQQQVLGAQGNNYILVGHSAGGLISRYVAQQLQGTQTPIRGVVTMDTPHQGANVTVNGPLGMGLAITAIGDGLSGFMGCQSPLDSMGCFLAAVGGSGVGFIGGFETVNSVGALHDMVPNSNFLTALNNPAEAESFQKAGIIGLTPQRWLIAREATSAIFGSTCYPESGCGEEAAADAVEYFYDAAEADFVLNVLLIEYCSESDNCPTGILNSLESQIGVDAVIMGSMDAVDGIYDMMMGCSFANLECEGSDGAVQTSSQYYPTISGTPIAAQISIPNADSHSGAPYSNLDHGPMDSALQQFGVQTTTASCNLTASPNVLNISASGGAETFSVVASRGCQWTAVSNQPWLTVNTQAGTSNGTVSISVQPNTMNTPLGGVVTVSGQASPATVLVYEAGACSYSLSVGPEIAVSGSGATGTVSVNTQPGCAWSAVSSAPNWLTIASGTGTGSGSFQYTAAPNSAGYDLSATIFAGGQNITVLQGTASGAAGTGTVTINGSPQSTSVNECPGNPHGPCMEYIQEGGAVVVWVNGLSYSVSYGTANDTSASLATALAAEMNSPLSFIAATVSGATITITATIDGVATDYPLSTSFGFNTSNFSTPAFQAIASGSYLTGGVN